MKSFELYHFSQDYITYQINGNTHTLEKIKERAISGEKIKKMVMLSAQKMEIQKTYAVINGDDKLLILRISTRVYFIITCLVSSMQVKRDTIKLYV